jgi:hypothetical protein
VAPIKIEACGSSINERIRCRMQAVVARTEVRDDVAGDEPG